MRHRPPHFQHVFSGGGYAAAYYSYMWSEVLDADAFRAFEETGDIFDAATAKRLRDNIYSAGGTRAPEELYTAFRGRLPTLDALLARRGLDRRSARGRGVTAILSRHATLRGMTASMTILTHTAGHRRGVAAAPHAAAADAGRHDPRRGRQRARSDGGDGGVRSPPSIRT